MSIQSEISRIQSNVQDTINVIQSTGVTVPSGATSDNLPGLATALANEKQDKLIGTQGQVVGFDAEGNAVAQESTAESLKPVLRTATLTISGWSNNSQTVTVIGVVADANAQAIDVSPSDKESADAWGESGVWCTTQGANSLTFTCDTVPSANISLNIKIQEAST